jgi:hypothetical protein
MMSSKGRFVVKLSKESAASIRPRMPDAQLGRVAQGLLAHIRRQAAAARILIHADATVADFQLHVRGRSSRRGLRLMNNSRVQH